jgi:O-antigen/teichoic acid export membrane protein
VLAVCLAAGAGWIAADWLQLQGLSPSVAAEAITVMGVVLAVQWLGTLYRSAVLGLQDQVWLSAMSAGVATARALATVAVLAWVAPTITAFLAVQCAASAAETGLLALRVYRRLPRAPRTPRFSLDALRQVWRFAAGLSAIMLLATLLTQVDKLLLSKLLPLSEFGYFSLAVAVATALATLITPVHNVAYPRLCELVAGADAGRLAVEYHRFAQLLTLMVVPATLVLSVFSHEVMLAWTQDPAAARQVSPILSIWVLGTALNGVMHVPYAAQLAHGWARLTMAVNAVAVLVLVPAILFWVPRHGAIAAAWIWVLLNVGYAVFTVGCMHRRILRGEQARWYVDDIGRPLLAGTLAVLALAALHRELEPLTRGGEVAFLTVSGVLVTVCAALVTDTGQAALRGAYAVMKRPKLS